MSNLSALQYQARQNSASRASPRCLSVSSMELSFSSITPGRGRTCPLAGLLHRGSVKTREWNPCLLHRPKNFVQQSFGQTGYWKRKDAYFMVLCGQTDERGAVHVVEGSCIDEIYDALAKRLLPTAAAASNSNLKFLVGLAGPPGAGKSTVAHEVVSRINKLWPEKSSSLDSQVKPSDVATVIPMDGFHCYRSELDAMEDPQEAHARRGATWTFNPSRLLTCLKNLRSQGSVFAPSFDHGVGDPVEDDIFVSFQHKVVIIEGNYLLLEDGIWKELSSLFDEKWFIDVDIDKAMQRVLKRHISTGKPPDVAKYRIEYNDRPNAELVMKSKKNADLVIKSVDF